MSILIIVFERRSGLLDLCNRTQDAAVIRTSPATASTFTAIESALREASCVNVSMVIAFAKYTTTETNSAATSMTRGTVTNKFLLLNFHMRYAKKTLYKKGGDSIEEHFHDETPDDVA